MNPGFIIYIEDSESQRKALKMALKLLGFKVEVAGNVTDARRLFEKHQKQVDVVVLDMRLEDPEWPQMTGADIAMEYFDTQTPYAPEFLIHSAYSEVDYYKLAWKLGVATYLEKSEYRQDDIIRHIRALAIKRALSVKNPETSDRIQRIVETSRDQSEAIEKFCRHELEPELAGRLGTSFIFLLSEGHRTSCYTSEASFPGSLDLYEVIQTLVFSDIQPKAPFILDACQMPPPRRKKSCAGSTAQPSYSCGSRETFDYRSACSTTAQILGDSPSLRLRWRRYWPSTWILPLSNYFWPFLLDGLFTAPNMKPSAESG
jgi:DNA-binding response OmpR family regulator